MQSTHGYYSHRLNMIKTSNEDFYRITSPFRTVVFLFVFTCSTVLAGLDRLYHKQTSLNTE